jgi:hypothetical protein
VRISALRLHNVRRFGDRGVAIEGIGAGVNVLCAPNEAGKSTSFEALHALFFLDHGKKGKDVQLLRPYSRGNPLVEADVETGAGRFRLRKQFLGAAKASVVDLVTGRLVAQADEAENFIKGLVGGDAMGPAGLLWVRQGITALDEPGRKADEGERALRESLLGSVQGEVEAVTGGRRMSDILAACEGELSALVTETGRPKASGLYFAAIEERDRLRKREAVLAAEVASLRAALDTRAKARRDLAHLEREDEKAARRDAVAKAEEAHAAAKEHEGRLAAAAAEAALAKDRHADAASRFTAYREDLAREEACRRDLLAAARRRDEATGRRDEVRATLDRLRAEGAEAEAEERDARDLLARLDAAMAALTAAKELDGLRARLAEAERVRSVAEERRAALALVRLPADAVDGLQRIEIELAGLRAAEEAGLPAFRIDYAEDATPARIEGVAVEPGRDHSVRDVARLALPGIGTLTLRSNRPPDANAALGAAEARRTALLAKLGVADIAEARRREADAHEMAAEIARLETELRHLAPEGGARLHEEVAVRARLAAPSEPPPGDAAEARTILTEADTRMKAARSAARATEPLLHDAHDAVVAADTELRTLDAEAARLGERLGPCAERAACESGLGEIEAAARARFEEKTAIADSLRAAAPDLVSATAMLARARSVEEAASREASRLTAELSGFDASIRHHSEDAVEETWRETQEALAAAETRVLAFAREAAVLTRLRGALQAARAEARDLYLEPVLRELKPLLGLLFDGAEIRFDEKTLLPRSITRAGQDEDIDRLSGGMREQLSVLTRLAFARLLARDGRAAPVILDDALVYSDDDRIERMFDALHRQAGGHQIIVFSCRQRAFSMLGGTTLRMIPWEPGVA